MSKDNKILEYISDYIYLKSNDMDEGLESLQAEGREKYVTLEDVGNAFIRIIDDFASEIDVSQGLTEVRLKAVIDSLPEDIKKTIYNTFAEAQDDMLIEEGEEISDE